MAGAHGGGQLALEGFSLWPQGEPKIENGDHLLVIEDTAGVGHLAGTGDKGFWAVAQVVVIAYQLQNPLVLFLPHTSGSSVKKVTPPASALAGCPKHAGGNPPPERQSIPDPIDARATDTHNCRRIARSGR